MKGRNNLKEIHVYHRSNRAVNRCGETIMVEAVVVRNPVWNVHRVVAALQVAAKPVLQEAAVVITVAAAATMVMVVEEEEEDSYLQQYIHTVPA
jgi:hypothetical protein